MAKLAAALTATRLRRWPPGRVDGHPGRADDHQALSGEPGDTHVLRIANKWEPADMLPMLLMVGQVGWQVHVRILTVPSEDASSRRTLTPQPPMTANPAAMTATPAADDGHPGRR